jgi:ribosomal protein L16 Arg81 hydroxylase
MSIERIAAPSAAEFERHWRRPRRPVVIAGAIEDWPARRAWSAESLARRFGERRILVGRTRAQLIAHDPAGGIDYDRVRLDEFLRAPRGYAVFALEEWLPELAGDLGRPAFRPEAPWEMRKLWLGPAGVGSPLHQDLTENLYAQIAGRKQVTLFHPRDGRHLYRHPLLSRLPNFSRVDIEAPDPIRFPRFPKARPLRVVLEPGDLLYLPRRWWHQMRCLDFSISVSDWWATGASLWVVYAGLLYKKLRALRY